jgi:hypothetical protein
MPTSSSEPPNEKESARAPIDSEPSEDDSYIMPSAPDISDFDPALYTLADIKHLYSNEDLYYVNSPDTWFASDTEKFPKQGNLIYIRGEKAGVLLESVYEICGVDLIGLYLIQRIEEYRFRLIHFNPTTKEIKEIKDNVYTAVFENENTAYLANYSLTDSETPPVIERLNLVTGESSTVMTADYRKGEYDGVCSNIVLSLNDNRLSVSFEYIEVEFARYRRRVEVDITNLSIIKDSENSPVKTSDLYNLYKGYFTSVDNPEREEFWIGEDNVRVRKDTPGFLPENETYCSNLHEKDGLYFYLCSRDEGLNYFEQSCVFDGEKSTQLQLYDKELNKIPGEQPRISWGDIFEYGGELYLIGQTLSEKPEDSAQILCKLAGTKENPAETQLLLMILDTKDVHGGFGPFSFSRAGPFVIIDTRYPRHIVIKNLINGYTATLFSYGLELYDYR